MYNKYFKIKLKANIKKNSSKIYFEESDIVSVLFEASTTHHQAVLSNQTVMVRANAALQNKMRYYIIELSLNYV